ncbi:MAG TPA: hypothetical protein DGG94_07620 [Micromonosporaceae bacterium]|nr:hypothetical protein [Micromonosporaceae bacterium]HCU49655.1 hypothetical protein [Micromonosporaceae bacterium]
MPEDGRVAKLILGPVVRRVVGDQAVVWFQTDQPCSVEISGGGQTAQARTHTFEGVHLAWVVVGGLPSGPTAYEVHVDGSQVWPLPGFPPSVITTGSNADATIAFGSCREPRDHGVDALEAYAKRAMAGAPLPDLLALIGDQIYADSLSPQTISWLSTLDRPAHYPADQVVTFAEYVELYREAWSAPEVRWLLSTVPTVMIFDDHEIMDDWNSSASWVADMHTKPWWAERTRAGLTSYWLFQHLGNLPPGPLSFDSLPSRWSFTIDIGRTRLIMMDCRGSRVLDGPVRRMFPQEDWDWLAAESQVDCDHLVLACSLPWLLAPVIHHGEALMEVLSHRFGGPMERLRRKYDLEHWSAVGHSFAELTSLIQQAKTPTTISVVGGDVHHSYVAEASIEGRPSVHQITCSPLNNSVDAVMKTLLRIGWIGAGVLGKDRAGVRWRPLMRPYFGNAIATLTAGRILLEATTPTGTLTALYSR